VPAELDPKPLQLPSGRHGLSRDAVASQQRRRMLDAVAAVLRRESFVSMTVEDIASLAGVSRRTFYEHFTDKTDCFLAAYDDAVQRLVVEVRAATADVAGAEAQARCALSAALRFFAADVDLARLAVIEILGAGPHALAVHDAALRRLIGFVAAEEPVAAARHAPPPIILQMLAGEVSQAVYTEVLHGRAAELEQLEPMLMYLLLAPMYGPEEAARRSGQAEAGPMEVGEPLEPMGEPTVDSPASPSRVRERSRLPRGRHRLDPVFVRDHQRERLLDSMAAMAAAKGYARVTVSDVTGHAGVSRRTFYDQFEDKKDCFLATFDAFGSRLLARATELVAGEGTWEERISRALAVILRQLTEEPSYARVALVEILGAGRAALERRDAVLDAVAALLQPTEGSAPPTVLADRRLARAIVGGGYETLYAHLLSGERPLTDLFGDLLYCVLVPYLGHAGALEQRARATGAAAG
jgi:AcrR family transcriptional regulator